AALDGVVAGVGNSYPQGEFATAWMMLTERLLTPGEHRLHLYALGGAQTRPYASSSGPRPPPPLMRIAFGTDERTPVTDSVKALLAERGHDVDVVGEGDPWPDVGRGVGEGGGGGTGRRG